MKCVWCVLMDNDTNFQCNPSDLYISHAGLRFKHLFRCTIYCLLFLAITMQEYNFNSCITSSFTSRNLKQKPTRQADLRNNNWNAGLCMSQRKWFKLSQQNTFCYTVGDCLIFFFWLRANQGIGILNLCSFYSLFLIKGIPLMNANPHCIATERLVLAPRLLFQQKGEAVNVAFYLFLVICSFQLRFLTAHNA